MLILQTESDPDIQLKTSIPTAEAPFSERRKAMLKTFTDMLITALYAMVVQNLVFNASYGLSESIRMAKKPKQFIMFGFCITLFCTLSSVVCTVIYKIPALSQLELKYCCLIFTAVLCLIYLIAAVIFRKLFHADKKFLNSLGMCAFNTLVLALPFLSLKAGGDILHSLSLGVGAGLAFVLSLLLINAGMRHIRSNEHIPAFFKGTPALFIYVSLIALSLSCISGEALFL